MRTDRRVATAAAGAVLLALGGCGSSDPSDPAPSTGFAATTWASAADDAKDADQLRPVRVRTTRSGVPHVPFGVEADGDLLATRITGRSAQDPLGTPHVGRLSATRFTPLPYDDSASRGRQVTSIAHDGDRVVWVETRSIDPALFDWTIWTSNGKDRRKVDTSDRIGPASKQRRVFGQTEPVVSGTHLFWAAPDGELTAVLGGPAPLAASGLPAVSGSTLYTVHSPQVSSSSKTWISARDLGTGRETTVVSATLDEGTAVTRLAASEHHLAWVVSDPEAETSELFVRDLRSDETRGIRMDHPGLQTMSLGLSDQLLVWGNGSSTGDAGEYALDLDDGALWRLHEEPGYSVAFVDGSTVAWADGPDDPDAPVDFEVVRDAF